MSDRADQILAKAIRVMPTDMGLWRRVGGDAPKLPSQMIVSPVDLRWLVGTVNSTEAIMRERNTWARQLADANDEAATAKAEAEKARSHQADALDWATTRVADLEVAVQKVLKNMDGTDEELNQALRNLRAVWARA